MFRIASKFIKIPALILPIALLFSGLACVLICSEVTEHTGLENAAHATIENGANDCAGVSGFAESCPLTVTHAALQERPAIDAHTPLNSAIADQSKRAVRCVPKAVPDSKINQHSPPEFSPPLYLKLRTFRI